jgi:hypothetical protein
VVPPTDDRPTATTLEVAVEILVPPATGVQAWAAAATTAAHSRASAATTATTWAAAASAATNASASSAATWAATTWATTAAAPAAPAASAASAASATNASAACSPATALGVRRCEDEECSCCYCDKRKLAEHEWISQDCWRVGAYGISGPLS